MPIKITPIRKLTAQEEKRIRRKKMFKNTWMFLIIFSLGLAIGYAASYI